MDKAFLAILLVFFGAHSKNAIAQTEPSVEMHPGVFWSQAEVASVSTKGQRPQAFWERYRSDNPELLEPTKLPTKSNVKLLLESVGTLDGNQFAYALGKLTSNSLVWFVTVVVIAFFSQKRKQSPTP